MLEQVLAISGKIVRHEDVVIHLGTPEKEVLYALLESVCTQDGKGVVASLVALQTGNSNALRVYDELLECVRQALLLRIGEGTPKDETLLRLGKEYPLVISSKLILNLLEKRHFLLVSDSHAWMAFTAVLLSTMEV
jgi:hypothetical protein